MFEDAQNSQMNKLKMFRKKSLSDELFLHFFFESSESDRVFSSLHYSNSIFGPGGIESEGSFGRHGERGTVDRRSGGIVTAGLLKLGTRALHHHIPSKLDGSIFCAGSV